MTQDAASCEWIPFECDGRAFEYLAMKVKAKETRPASWPAHKPFPGRATPAVMVVVRRLDETTGPGMVYPEGTIITAEHAVETARLFWTELTR